MFHLSIEFGVSESTVCRIVKKVEQALIQSERFQLPGKKTLQGEGFLGNGVEVVVVDVTECPVERPKKNSGDTTPARRSATPRKLRS